MDEAGEADVRNVAGGAEDAFKIPDCFCAADLSEGNSEEGLVRLAHALGYISSRKPPPFFLSNTPVKPHGWSWKGCTS